MKGQATRREFLAGALGMLTAARQPAGDRFLGLVPLNSPQTAPFGRVLATGLDARLFTDLSVLTSDRLTTPTEQFFVRTACPDAARQRRFWTIDVNRHGRAQSVVAVSTLQRLAHPIDPVLLECSGNADAGGFGLMSAAMWTGVPFAEVLRLTGQPDHEDLLRVSGVDHQASQMRTSVPGADWIFRLSDLVSAGAFLATGMNGQPLTPDHGGPVRLVVPGWYGCASIKWVDTLEFVGDDARATPQMREFAERTHQRRVPDLACDYLPARIDHAAVPIRIEKWQRQGRLVYRVVGIQWGGETPIDEWMIRFRSDLPFERVRDCAKPKTTMTWSLWGHEWRPETAGRYSIVLRTADERIQTRRMDMDFYRRTFAIEAV